MCTYMVKFIGQVIKKVKVELIICNKKKKCCYEFKKCLTFNKCSFFYYCIELKKYHFKLFKL